MCDDLIMWITDVLVYSYKCRTCGLLQCIHEIFFQYSWYAQVKFF